MGLGVGAALPQAARERRTVIVVERAVELDEVYQQRHRRNQARPRRDAGGKASATTNEGPAERRQHAGLQHGQHGQLVEWWKWKGERGELEQVQVAWERGMGKGGKQQPVR